ncbi:MAG: hypothetical protein ABR980_12295 [Ignavibacteriaceae bacterium]|jgi:hypothetical protein
MVRRFASILFIAIALMSFVASSSFARDENIPGMRLEKKVYVMHRKGHRVRRHRVIIRRHRRSDIRVKVNL